MHKKLCFALSLTVFCYWVNASPVKLDTLEFDKLDADLDNLKYEVEEEDLDDYSKLLDDADQTKLIDQTKRRGSNKIDDTDNDRSKTLGFKKRKSSRKGLKSKHNIEDLKKFFKAAGVKDQGRYYDDDVYAAIRGTAAEAVGVKGTEERKYKKGTKSRGFHRVHHKDEYKKDKEFYDEDETNGYIKKVGSKALGYKIGGGAGFNKGQYNRNHRKGIYGKEGFLDRGYQDRKYSDFFDDRGSEASYNNES